MRNIPKKIYLQVGEDVKTTDDLDFNDLTGVSWCSDMVFNSDIEYSLRKISITDRSKLLFNFFMWFRKNGEKYIDVSIEKMIDIYLKAKT